MDIDQVQVGFRYRKDLGDLRALAQSIEEVGLLHPVVVNSKPFAVKRTEVGQ